ncbi:hypothetical protein [Maricaulis virginensis]|uniref:Uncharacterized protein n=1 Tax=Maricaulis virginensis TaxID=144022 RepID=A0A9W6MM66_9PROT|nr:hypothetical protein [Maricaulis virginensis]GLK50877.1 hypothetical protein GCM10017621_03850 [Maricaulis virginensis]
MPIILSQCVYGPPHIEPDCKISCEDLEALHERVGVSTTEDLYEFLQLAAFGYRQANAILQETTPSQRKKEMERVSRAIRKLALLLGDEGQPGAAFVHMRFNDLMGRAVVKQMGASGLTESASAASLADVMRDLAACADALDERAKKYRSGRLVDQHNPGLSQLVENIFRFWLKLPDDERHGEFSYYQNINTGEPNLATRLVLALVGAIDPDVKPGAIKKLMGQLTPQRRTEIAAEVNV